MVIIIYTYYCSQLLSVGGDVMTFHYPKRADKSTTPREHDNGESVVSAHAYYMYARAKAPSRGVGAPSSCPYENFLFLFNSVVLYFTVLIGE